MSSNIRPESMLRINSEALAQAFIDEQVKALREQIGRSTEDHRIIILSLDLALTRCESVLDLGGIAARKCAVGDIVCLCVV